MAGERSVLISSVGTPQVKLPSLSDKEKQNALNEARLRSSVNGMANLPIQGATTCFCQASKCPALGSHSFPSLSCLECPCVPMRAHACLCVAQVVAYKEAFWDDKTRCLCIVQACKRVVVGICLGRMRTRSVLMAISSSKSISANKSALICARHEARLLFFSVALSLCKTAGTHAGARRIFGATWTGCAKV